MKYGIYIASRCRHAQTWLDLREAGYPIISSWIDHVGDADAELWVRCINEPQGAQFFILYRLGDEPLKGALAELGSALGAGTPVFTVGCHDLKEYSFLHHPLVTICDTLPEALENCGVKP